MNYHHKKVYQVLTLNIRLKLTEDKTFVQHARTYINTLSTLNLVRL